MPYIFLSLSNVKLYFYQQIYNKCNKWFLKMFECSSRSLMLFSSIPIIRIQLYEENEYDLHNLT